MKVQRKEFKKNKGLRDKKRFTWLEKEKREFLRNLTVKKSAEILESLTSKETLGELKTNFALDHPLSLKLGLKKGKSGLTTSNF
jgi:hypothetical protein